MISHGDRPAFAQRRCHLRATRYGGQVGEVRRGFGGGGDRRVV